MPSVMENSTLKISWSLDVFVVFSGRLSRITVIQLMHCMHDFQIAFS